MSSRFLHVDSHDIAASACSDNPALDQALLRAYSIERSLDYGCSIDDVLKLRGRVEAGSSWSDIALQLANDDQLRASCEAESGRSAITSRFLLHAAACNRLAQAGLEHNPTQRLEVYERQAGYFAAAMKCVSADLAAEGLEVQRDGASHRAWLFRAPGMAEGGPAVVVWGGADGWCEAFQTSVSFYVERKLSVCLLELPGQGLARLQSGSVLRLDFGALVTATLDALIARGASSDRLGIVGHSAGGSLALAAAATDDRIRACCTNGGSPELKQGLLKYPRVLQRFGRMLGDAVSEAQALEFLDQLNLEKAAKSMRAKLLCLQGGRDVLVTDDEAHRLVQLRGANAAILEYWPEGAHCLYNHAFERNCVIANWFATNL